MLQLLNEIAQQPIKVVTRTDKDKEGKAVPLAEIDPFTVFASFCRNITLSNRRAQAKAFKQALNLTAPIPDDYNGVPQANNQAVWFFAYKRSRKADDVPALWQIAEAAALQGPEGITDELWQRCLAIQQVGLAKLTMGLFWVNPDAFLPLDANIIGLLNKNGFDTSQLIGKATPLSAYQKTLEQVRARFGDEFAKLSLGAWQDTKIEELPADSDIPPRCWAGGHFWSDQRSRLPEFKIENAWWHGFTTPDDGGNAKTTFDNYDQVKLGDGFIIKGYAGRHDLKVHYVGIVVGKEPEQRKLLLKPLPLPNPQTNKPRLGTGDWRATLIEINDEALLRWLFQGQPYTQSEVVVEDFEELSDEMNTLPSVPLNQILYGPPGTGKTYTTIEKAVDIIDGGVYEDHAAYKQEWDDLRADGQITFVTFHQSYGYEDFVEGLRPVIDDTEGEARYEVRDGVLKQMALQALGFALQPVQGIGETDPAADFARRWNALLQQVENEPNREYSGLRTARYTFAVSSRGNINGRSTNETSTDVVQMKPQLLY